MKSTGSGPSSPLRATGRSFGASRRNIQCACAVPASVCTCAWLGRPAPPAPAAPHNEATRCEAHAGRIQKQQSRNDNSILRQAHEVASQSSPAARSSVFSAPCSARSRPAGGQGSSHDADRAATHLCRAHARRHTRAERCRARHIRRNSRTHLQSCSSFKKSASSRLPGVRRPSAHLHTYRACGRRKSRQPTRRRVTARVCSSILCV